MARQLIEPRRNTNNQRPVTGQSKVHRASQPRKLASDAPKLSRLEWTKFVILLTFAVAALVSAARSTIANQGATGTKAEKVDWSVFLPEGSGRAEVALACASCHDLSQVITQKKSSSNWRSTVQKMISAYQAPVDKEDVQPVIDYLSKNFGEKNPIDQLPMNLNTSSAEALARLPGLTPELARAIVEDREASGAFASVEDLLRVKGIGATALNRIKAYLKTKD
jgi:competence ComEA-like helix-hairpin-helix protein